MIHRLKLLLLLCLFCSGAAAQNAQAVSCGQQQVMQHFYATHPGYKAINQQVEQLLVQHNRLMQSGTLPTQRTSGVVTLPVVVHIIHNNGAENISDAQVYQGIQHLNEAYANSGYYDPTDGVNTQIQFCMAQRDPSNNASNGITRDVSSATVMGGPQYYSDDQLVKDINRWNPLCYINIWLVRSIPTSVVGYAYLPSAHGSNADGIIIESAYWGSSFANDVVAAHEMGHYLGLYHTFEGGCTNNDCTSDGDKVCDTPPDQSTAGISCTSTANSCTTDILSGFATDQNDLTQDYMDYGNFNCMKVFTQGQSDRMNWFIQNVRKSLLACKSCMNPCPAPVTADFALPGSPFIAAANYTFTNTSVNAASYEWFINGVLQSSSANLNYTFPSTGVYSLKLVAHSGNALCDDAAKTTSISVVCGVTAGFTKSGGAAAAGTSINFNNSSVGADAYQWIVNGAVQSTAVNFSYTSSVAGDYIVQLVARNSPGDCDQTFSDTVHYTCGVISDFIPGSVASLINTPVTFTSTGSGAGSFQWLVNGVSAGSSSSLTYTFTSVGAYNIQLISGNGTCSATKTGIAYINDKCGNAQYQFQKNYAAGSNSGAVCIVPTGDGGSIVGTRIVVAGLINASILKLDAGGNAQWMSRYGANGNSLFRQVKPASDGGFIAIGTIENPAGTGAAAAKTFIVKTDAGGAINWSRELAIQGASTNEGVDIIQSADGNFYFTGTIVLPGVTGTTDLLAGKLDAAGNIIWITGYDAQGYENGNGLSENNSYIIVCGNRGGLNGTSGFLLQLNKTDGTVSWAKTYQSTTENFISVQTLPGGYYVNAQRTAAISGMYADHVYLKTDLNGKLNYSTYVQPFGPAGYAQGAASFVKPNGHIISQTSPQSLTTPYADFIVQEIDPATGVLWTKTYNRTSTWLNAVNVSAANELWMGGVNLSPVAPFIQTFVMKLDSAGNSGSCSSTNAASSLLPAFYNTGAVDFIIRKLIVQPVIRHTATPVSVTANILCQFVKCDSVPTPVDTCNTCGSLALSGIDTVCSFSSAVVYTVKRNPGCPAIPQWRLADPGIGTISKLNDSTISIAFSKKGNVWLYASMNTGCKTITDSLHISVLVSPSVISLGPDIQLCNFSTYKINAGCGFKSYLWNDGSVDSVLTAFNPGQYFVTAKDYCGNNIADTINLSQGPVIPFDLGPNLQKCDKDSVTITAPGTFSSYTWSANYNISNASIASVRVWPTVDTTYTVVAQVANGCTVIDSIRILVKHAPVLYIGTDTSFCTGDSIVYKPNNGFSNYSWHDGTSADSYIAREPGLYWLQAIAANGCPAKDSATVKSVYPLPVQFADEEAEVCEGKDLVLKALGNWNAYLWSDHDTTSTSTVHSPGKYWLQVTSENGCVARDTIVVSSSKGCLSGIWFPNAFTPDRNGYNDSFKPIVTGTLESFTFRIYNRFGEQVFETTDCKKGWAGIYKGQLQPAGGFVWYCMYQFRGSSPGMKKGTMLLIR